MSVLVSPSCAAPAPRAALHLRPTRSDDQAFLLQIEAGVSGHFHPVVGLRPDMALSLARLLLRGREQSWRGAWPQAHCLVLDLGQGPEAQRIGRLWLDDSGTAWQVLDICLLPKWQHQGLGSDALRALLQRADAAGATVHACLNENNPGLRLLRRLGFAITRWRPPTVQMERPPSRGAAD